MPIERTLFFPDPCYFSRPVITTLNIILGYTTFSDLAWNWFAPNKSVFLFFLFFYFYFFFNFQSKLISLQTITTKTVTIPISRHLDSHFWFCSHLWLLIAVTMVTVWIMIKFISNFKCWITRFVFKISTFLLLKSDEKLYYCLKLGCRPTYFCTTLICLKPFSDPFLHNVYVTLNEYNCYTIFRWNGGHFGFRGRLGFENMD